MDNYRSPVNVIPGAGAGQSEMREKDSVGAEGGGDRPLGWMWGNTGVWAVCVGCAYVCEPRQDKSECRMKGVALCGDGWRFSTSDVCSTSIR